MHSLVSLLVRLPQQIGDAIAWVGPLAARVTVGWVFLASGWGHLHDPGFVDSFRDTGIPWPDILLPFSSWVEFIGGILMFLGLFTRLAAVPLAINMAVAIRTVLWGDVDSLGAFLLLDETAYLAIFIWLAAAGPGSASVDRLLMAKV